MLHDRILAGQCEAGTKLNQGKLAKDFGVSVGVVREALLELQAWGLVETVDNRGVTVSEWNLKRLLESYDIREMLEGLAARLCCGRLDDQSYADLRTLAQQIHDCAADDEMNCRLDREFHYRIAQLSGSRALLRVIDTCWITNKMVWTGQPRGLKEVLPKRAQRTLRQHLEILEAIRSASPRRAERLAREHVSMARRSVANLIVQGKYEPQWLV